MARIGVVFANIGLLGGSFLVFELGLQIASVFFADVDRVTRPPWWRPDTIVPQFLKDDRLGHKGNPAWWRHDERGFRNDSAMSEATIVALGDSHTYGTSNDLAETWPRVLSTLQGERVYNMGVGGYGVAENEANLSIAFSLKPKLVIFGLYFGNDIYDGFDFARRNGLLGEFANSDLLEEILRLEGQRTLEEEIGFLFRVSHYEDERAADQTPSQEPPDTNSDEREEAWTVRRWLSKYSKLYGLLRTAKNQIAGDPEPPNALLSGDFDRARENLSERQLAFVSVYDGPEWKTILTAPYRLRTLDDADPRISTGLKVSKEMIVRMQSRVSEAGANFIVLLLPTKEFVFWPRIENPQDHKSLAKLVRYENRIREEIKTLLSERGIDVIDPIEELRNSEHQPYFSDGDGHPNALGHRIIGAAVNKFVSENQSLQVPSR